MGEKEVRLKEIRREIGALLDEALTLTDAQSSERQWIEAIWDLLAELDAQDALAPRSNNSSDC